MVNRSANPSYCDRKLIKPRTALVEIFQFDARSLVDGHLAAVEERDHNPPSSSGINYDARLQNAARPKGERNKLVLRIAIKKLRPRSHARDPGFHIGVLRSSPGMAHTTAEDNGRC